MPSDKTESPNNEMMENLAQMVSKAIPKGFGFCVLCYKFNPQGTRTNEILFVSDTNKSDVVVAMQKFIEIHEKAQFKETKNNFSKNIN